jgi:hypothetical protein
VAITTTAFVPEVYSRQIIEKIAPLLTAMNFANTNWEGEVQRKGDTVHVVTPSAVTVGEYRNGTPISSQSLSPSDETLVVNRGDYFSFDLEDADSLMSPLDIVGIQAQEAARGLAKAAETLIYGTYASVHSDNKITGSAGAAIDVSPDTADTSIYELLVEAALRLNTKDVPQDRRWVVVSPYVHSLMLLSTKYFVRASALGDMVVTTARFDGARANNTPGFLGQIAGFDVYMSNNLPTSSTNKYILFGQGTPIAYAAAIPTGKISMMELEDSFAIRVKGLLLHGAKIFTEESKKIGSILVDNS